MIVPGIRHRCNKTSVVANVKSIVQNALPGKGSEQIISTLLQNKVKAVQKAARDYKIELASISGKRMRVSINPSKKRALDGNLKVSINDMEKMQTNLSLSQNQTPNLAAMIRVSSKSRKPIEPNLKQTLVRNGHRFNNFFEVKTFDFQSIKANKITDVTSVVVYCNNLKDFIEYVKQQRKVSDVHLKFGVDGGGGFFKVCLSIQSTNTEDKKRVRNRYEDGVAAKAFLDTGVKKLFIIGITQCQENYYNVAKLWSAIGISSFDGKYHCNGFKTRKHHRWSYVS